MCRAPCPPNKQGTSGATQYVRLGYRLLIFEKTAHVAGMHAQKYAVGPEVKKTPRERRRSRERSAARGQPSARGCARNAALQQGSMPCCPAP